MRKAAIEDDRKSSDGDVLPLFVLADDTVGDSGGDGLLIPFARKSECNALLFAWWAECRAAEMLAKSDWNDWLDEYNEPTLCGNIGDGGALVWKIWYECLGYKQLMYRFGLTDEIDANTLVRALNCPTNVDIERQLSRTRQMAYANSIQCGWMDLMLAMMQLLRPQPMALAPHRPYNGCMDGWPDQPSLVYATWLVGSGTKPESKANKKQNLD